MQKQDKMIIDGTNLILGRLGSLAVKQVLLGEKIEIINCGKIVITGKRESIFEKERKKLARGIPSKGPFSYKTPDRFVRRALRGMLPYKKWKGKSAFDNIKCYEGVPEKLKNEKFETFEKANIKKAPTLNYIKIEDICREIGCRHLNK